MKIISVEIDYVIQGCNECGVLFMVTKGFNRRKRKTEQPFIVPMVIGYIILKKKKKKKKKSRNCKRRSNTRKNVSIN